MHLKKILFTSALTAVLLLCVMAGCAPAASETGGSQQETGQPGEGEQHGGKGQPGEGEQHGGKGQPGDGEQHGGKEAYSSTVVTIPEQLADGTYTGAAAVEPDDDEGFDFYPITVAVKITDGSVESLAVTGASGSNAQYSKRAETGINQALAGKSAGEYEVDAISMATCSTKGIVQAFNAAMHAAPSDTSMSLGEAIYDMDGTVFTITVSAPDPDVDYSDITLSYAVGKFADDLQPETDYAVELLSQSEEQVVYQVTILPSGGFVIEDDDLTHSGSYNNLGQSLDVLVAGHSAGRVIITSSAVLRIENNRLVMTGGNGETLEQYIESISGVTISSGGADPVKYTTQWQHDIEPEYTGADFFHSDGSINFDIAPFAGGASGRYTITVVCEGYNDVTAEIGGANAAGSQGR